MLSSVFMQLYIFITVSYSPYSPLLSLYRLTTDKLYKQTGMLIRTEAILTELVFEHALRIRMKEDARGETKSEGDRTTALPTPTPQSESEPDANGNAHTAESSATVVGSETSASPKGKAKASSSPPTPTTPTPSTPDAKESGPSNLVGKITNLITTDLGNITDGRDFLFPLWYAPLQAGFCIWFLWEVLGWA
jgi:hypothetical protein